MRTKTKVQKTRRIENPITSSKETMKILDKNFSFPEFELDTVEINSIMRLDAKHYQEDMESLPTMLLVFGRLQAKADKKIKRLQTEYDIWKAEMSLKIRDRSDADGEKLTENKIQNLIRKERDYKIKKNLIYRAQEEFDILKSIYWSINKKSEFLAEIAAQRRNFNKIDNQKI